MHPTEIFIVKSTSHFLDLQDKLCLRKGANGIYFVSREQNLAKAADLIQSIEKAVVWVCDDWWTRGDEIGVINDFWAAVMSIPDLEFVNYDKQFSVANI